MITEKGTIKTSTKMDEKVLNELNAPTRNLGILDLVIGVIISVIAIVMYVVDIFNDAFDDFDFMVLFLGVVFLALGIFIMISYNNLKRTANKNVRVQEPEFFSDHIIAREYTDGEHTATIKIYYKWIVRTRETKNYLFLYNTRVSALAVDKNSLPPNELDSIRALLKGAPQPAPVQNVQPTENSNNNNDNNNDNKEEQ